MNQRIRLPLSVLLTLSIVAILSTRFAAAADDAGTTAALAAAIAGPQRSDANKARDKYRHPLETLTFFGIKPDMTVVEVSPGTGWYTEILAPLLKDHGKLYEAVGGGAGAKKFEDKLKADSAIESLEVILRRASRDPVVNVSERQDHVSAARGRDFSLGRRL